MGIPPRATFWGPHVRRCPLPVFTVPRSLLPPEQELGHRAISLGCWCLRERGTLEAVVLGV